MSHYHNHNAIYVILVRKLLKPLHYDELAFWGSKPHRSNIIWPGLLPSCGHYYKVISEADNVISKSLNRNYGVK